MKKDGMLSCAIKWMRIELIICGIFVMLLAMPSMAAQFDHPGEHNFWRKVSTDYNNYEWAYVLNSTTTGGGFEDTYAEGWKLIDNQWYYFAKRYGRVVPTMAHDSWVGNYYVGSDGVMLTNCMTPDGYTVDASGLWTGARASSGEGSSGNTETATVTVPTPKGYGIVEGVVTYQYNRYIGTRADVGAKIYLIPLDYSIKGGENSAFSLMMDTNGRIGVLYTTPDGYGHYKFDSVPTGNYRILIQSNNARTLMPVDNPEKLTYSANRIATSILTDEEMTHFRLVLGAYKFMYKDVAVENGKSLTVSNDFGYTEI